MLTLRQPLPANDVLETSKSSRVWRIFGASNGSLCHPDTPCVRSYPLAAAEPLIHTFTMSPAKSRCDAFENQHESKNAGYFLDILCFLFGFWFQNGCKILLKY